jgi:hypothetical protein
MEVSTWIQARGQTVTAGTYASPRPTAAKHLYKYKGLVQGHSILDYLARTFLL